MYGIRMENEEVINTYFAKWRLISLATSLVFPLAALCLAFAVTALFGYFANIELFYRPLEGGPATHPLTASAFFFLAFAILLNDTHRPLWQLFNLPALTVVCLFLITNSMDALIDVDLASRLTPFQAEVDAERMQGKHNKMGLNTTLMLAGITLAQLFFRFGRVMTAQLCSFIAVILPLASFTGHAYGARGLYGEMSLVSSTLGFTLAIASLAMTAHVAPLRALLSPFASGKIARLQTVMSYLVPSFLGFVSIKYFAFEEPFSFGLFVVLVSWFFIIMVCVSAVYQEHIELKRREAVLDLTHAANTDPLTGLANRRYFFEVCNSKLSTVSRSTDRPLWMLMIDVDHFKRINDNAGHNVGDVVLKTLAEILALHIRSSDIIARLGGEEFAILLSETLAPGAERVAEKIRKQSIDIKIAQWPNNTSPVTVSIGVAYAEPGMDIAQLLQLADDAMYRAKEAGRNRVVFAEQPYYVDISS